MHNILATAEVSSTTFDGVLETGTKLVSWGGELISTIVSNPILVTFVAASFVGVGLGIVRKLTRTAKG